MRYTTTKLAAIAGLSLLVIPRVRGANFDVIVGGPGILKYDPPFVNAAVGDVVRFIFKQKNHTATQSTFESPCTPAQGGFDSGFIPVADSVVDDFPVAELTLSNTNPTWVYCKQGNHCKQGMVFAVNPGDRFAAFQAAATGGSPPPSPSAASTTAAPSVVTVTATVTISNGQPFTTTYTTAPSAISAAPSASASSAATQDHRVIVGGPNKLLYDPQNITAQVGDTITFEFHQKNHTVTASSFAQPCRALSLTSLTGELGFDSGFVPVADTATTFPTWTIQVNDTKPIWAYCRQGNHCGQGMVFSVNAVESGPNNFAAFQEKAKQLNGTAATSASGAPSPSASNSTPRGLSVQNAGVALALVATFLGSLL
ncbi:hypothetical protein HGRIS_013565 [Hohenbuehelia grisea]|uniref:Cupredoxin n=1 Tax=Hohenbuehelia grisea TaxID=104357 RepID=A0ABR3IW33_9AGAR